MAAMLVKAGSVPAAKNRKPTFSDVSARHWAYRSIESAAAAGLLKGSKGRYRPNDPVTRAEAATLLLALSQENIPNVKIPDNVKGVKANHWARNSIAVALQANLLRLYADGSFEPDSPISRGQIARGLALTLTSSPKLMRTALAAKLIPVKGTVELAAESKASEKIVTSVDCGQGSKIKTGPDSEAKLEFADGSSLLMKADTELNISENQGQEYIKQGGEPGQTVGYLEVKLLKGKLFGVLATSYLFQQEEQSQETKTASAEQDKKGTSNSGLKTFAADENDKEQINGWWQEATAKKVRVKVDMPWGVAGIRGTVWGNVVDSSGTGTTSVIDGSVQVSTPAGTVSVPPGNTSVVAAQTAAPEPPKPMTVVEQKSWQEVKTWVQETAQVIKESAPVVDTVKVETERPVVVQQTQTQTETRVQTQQQAQTQTETQKTVVPVQPVLTQAVEVPAAPAPEIVLPSIEQAVQQIISSFNQVVAPAAATTVPVPVQAQNQIENQTSEPVITYYTPAPQVVPANTIQFNTDYVSGNIFSVPIEARNMSGLYAFELNITYNKDYLQVQQVGVNTNKFPLSVAAKADQSTGTIKMIASKSGTSAGETGNFVLGGITFKVIGTGQSALNFTSVQLLNSDVTFAAANASNNQVGVSTAVLTGSGTNLVRLDTSAAAGTEFDVPVVMSSAQDIYGAELTVTYDPARLEAMSVTGNTAVFPLVAVKSYDNTNGKAKLVISKQGSVTGASGSVTLGTIHFRVVASGSTTLNFAGVRVCDSKNGAAAVNAVNTSITI